MGTQEQEGENVISQKIKLIRGFLRMNQTQFGEAIGVSRMAVGLWESKARKTGTNTKILPSSENYEKIAALVGIESFLIRTPDIGPEYLFHVLTELKRPGSDCPLTDKELMDDFQWWLDSGLREGKGDISGMFKDMIKDEGKKAERVPEPSMEAEEIRKKLANSDLTNKEQLELIKKLSKINYETEKFHHMSNYNHSRKGLTGNKEDTFYFGDEKTAALKPTGGPYRITSSRVSGPLSDRAKAWLNQLDFEKQDGEPDSVPEDYHNLIKKKIDSITDKAKELNKNRGSKGSRLETKSNGFWVAVQYFVDKQEIPDCHFFKTMFYDDYEHKYDLWVKKARLMVRFCTLHKRNEIDLLKAEIEKLVGSLFILEKIIGLPQRKEIWVYDRESDKAGKFTSNHHPSWLESLQKTTGINIAYVRDADLTAKLVVECATSVSGKENQNESNRKIREAHAKVWGQASL